jgi:hypothetical protein
VCGRKRRWSTLVYMGHSVPGRVRILFILSLSILSHVGSTKAGKYIS